METTCTVGGLSFELLDSGWQVTGYKGQDKNIVIPSEIDATPVTFIKSKAFEDCQGMESVFIPDSVTFIGNFAFQGCTGLKNLRISHSVHTLNLGTFWGCSALEHAEVPPSVTNLGDGAFRNCSALTSVEIPNSVTVLGDSAFRECTALPAVSIPSSVTKVSRSAFRDCSALTLVEMASSVTYVGPRAFQGCSSLTSITIVGEDPRATASAFLNTQTMYLVADYLVSLQLIPFDTAKSMLMSKDPAEKLLAARIAVTHPERLGEIPGKFPLIKALAEAGRTNDLRVLEKVPGYFTRAFLLRGIDAAAKAGATEALAYLMDRKAALDTSAATTASTNESSGTKAAPVSVSSGLEL